MVKDLLRAQIYPSLFNTSQKLGSHFALTNYSRQITVNQTSKVTSGEISVLYVNLFLLCDKQFRYPASGPGNKDRKSQVKHRSSQQQLMKF